MWNEVAVWILSTCYCSFETQLQSGGSKSIGKNAQDHEFEKKIKINKIWSQFINSCSYFSTHWHFKVCNIQPRLALLECDTFRLHRQRDPYAQKVKVKANRLFRLKIDDTGYGGYTPLDSPTIVLNLDTYSYTQLLPHDTMDYKYCMWAS